MCNKPLVKISSMSNDDAVSTNEMADFSDYHFNQNENSFTSFTLRDI